MTNVLRPILVLVTFAAAVHSHAAQAGGAASSRGMFEKLYADIHVAFVQKDRAAYAALLTPDFASEDVSGKVESRSEALAEFDQLQQDPNRKGHTSVLAVDKKAMVATVTQRYQSTTTRPGNGGMTAKMEFTAVSVDTWKNISGSWQMSRTVTHQMDVEIDGHSVVHKTHL